MSGSCKRNDPRKDWNLAFEMCTSIVRGFGHIYLLALRLSTLHDFWFPFGETWLGSLLFVLKNFIDNSTWY
ncbi:hypothetical protein GOP47_0020145 [Adiantum capillus-veneris]|uniref:Uncharacterized protein n=1 Tax=Adiantum capillus-veneris TaxID=13818 RepID=A0A9D4UCN6_ADICA|nr:hypothetical protein GOP47_0020145 [Adiantum capillus-veneris]